MPLLVLALLVLGLGLFLLARRGRQRSGVPAGDVIYSDTWQRVEQPLFSRKLGLTGRPDYLVEHSGCLVPVEVKSAAAPPDGPYDSHVFQLAAYCVLVAEHYGRRPARGYIRYPDRSYVVEFTAALERQVLGLLEQMRAEAEAEDVHRSHNSAARCRGCGYQEVCDEALSTI
jgi:CRISPR-associated exonuclease Cas4